MTCDNVQSVLWQSCLARIQYFMHGHADAGIEVEGQVGGLCQYGGNGHDIWTSLDQYSGTCLFVGVCIATCSWNDMFQKISGIRVGWASSGAFLSSIAFCQYKCMMLQNLPSVMVSYRLCPQPGETILDIMHGAPGGKLSHVASLMKNPGVTVACDKFVENCMILYSRSCFRELALERCDNTSGVGVIDNACCWYLLVPAGTTPLHFIVSTSRRHVIASRPPACHQRT